MNTSRMPPEGEDLFPSKRVPEGDRPIETPAGQASAVGAEGDGADPVCPTLEHADLLARGDLLDTDLPVRRGRGQVGAVRTERHLHDGVATLLRTEDGLTGAQLPELDRAVVAELAPGTGQPSAVRAEGPTVDAARGHLEDLPSLAGRQIPEPDLPVQAGRGQEPAVGAEGHTVDDLVMPFQSQQELPGGEILDLHLAGERPGPRPVDLRVRHGQALAVRGNGQAVAEAGGELRGAELLTRGQVPHGHPGVGQEVHLPQAAGRGNGEEGAPGMEPDAPDFAVVLQELPAGGHVPHLDGPIRAGAGQLFAVGTEGERADALLVSFDDLTPTLTLCPIGEGMG